jgi:hypothetical protein
MNNIEKKLDALIDALGFDLVEDPVFMARPDGTGKMHIRTDIKITKRNEPVVNDWHEAMVPISFNSKAWSAVVEYITNHAEDIEAGANDFGTLRPMWDFFNGNITK